MIFGLTTAWIENDHHLELKMADNWSRTRMCNLHFLDPELLHIQNLKRNYIEVDLHMEYNPANQCSKKSSIL